MHGIAEQGRVAVRNIRRDVMHDLRELKNEGEVGSDDEHRAESELQKLTDSHVGEIDTRARRQGRRDPRGVTAASRARYVAIITDGNGRWAQRRGLPVLAGHQAGADVVKARLRDAVELGVEELTVYSFSTENWTRPRAEVDGLMAMFASASTARRPSSHEEGVRMRFVGRREGLDAELVAAHGLGRGDRPPATTGSPCSWPSTTAAGRRSSTRREPSQGRPRRSSGATSTHPTCTTPTS